LKRGCHNFALDILLQSAIRNPQSAIGRVCHNFARGIAQAKIMPSQNDRTPPRLPQSVNGQGQAFAGILAFGRRIQGQLAAEPAVIYI
jgi:hypothetical protein